MKPLFSILTLSLGLAAGAPEYVAAQEQAVTQDALLRLVVMPRFIGRSLMSRCSGFPVSLSTILMPKGESELR